MFTVRVGACHYPTGGRAADDGGVTVDTDRRRRTAATVVFTLALGEALTTVVAGAASGLGWARLADLFVVTNAAIGLSLAVCGWLIAFHRPRNAVGWSLLAGGGCYGSTATGLTLLAWAGEPSPPWRLLATAINGGWTWRWPCSSRWRWCCFRMAACPAAAGAGWSPSSGSTGLSGPLQVCSIRTAA